jgi:hypothetical protein
VRHVILYEKDNDANAKDNASNQVLQENASSEIPNPPETVYTIEEQAKKPGLSFVQRAKMILGSLPSYVIKSNIDTYNKKRATKNHCQVRRREENVGLGSFVIKPTRVYGKKSTKSNNCSIDS